jgi:hypothetical protein
MSNGVAMLPWGQGKQYNNTDEMYINYQFDSLGLHV